jgi:hypothetical protein
VLIANAIDLLFLLESTNIGPDLAYIEREWGASSRIHAVELAIKAFAKFTRSGQISEVTVD